MTSSHQKYPSTNGIILGSFIQQDDTSLLHYWLINISANLIWLELIKIFKAIFHIKNHFISQLAPKMCLELMPGKLTS